MCVGTPGGVTARCWPPNVLVWGQTLGQPAATEEGELGRAAGPGDKVASQRLGLLGGVRSWTPAMGSYSGAELAQTHLKGSSGGSLSTQLCLGPGCSEAPPQQPGAVSGSALFSLTNAICAPPQPAPRVGWGFLRSSRGFGQALPQHEPPRITGAASQQDLTALPLQDGGCSQQHSYS